MLDAARAAPAPSAGLDAAVLRLARVRRAVPAGGETLAAKAMDFWRTLAGEPGRQRWLAAAATFVVACLVAFLSLRAALRTSPRTGGEMAAARADTTGWRGESIEHDLIALETELAVLCLDSSRPGPTAYQTEPASPPRLRAQPATIDDAILFLDLDILFEIELLEANPPLGRSIPMGAPRAPACQHSTWG